MQRKSNDQTLAEILQQWIKVMKVAPKLHEITIENQWATVMGKTVAQHTKALKLRGKVLYVEIDAAALRSELHYERERIRTMVNEMLGEPFLMEVVLR